MTSPTKAPGWLPGGFLVASLLVLVGAPAASSAPVPADSRLTLDLVAREPDVVTPTGLAVDEAGRVWVIENHTHERPATYTGPPTDRVRVFADFGPDGRARHVHTFAEGFRNSMSLALGPAGAVYLATRSDVWLLRDSNGDGVADQRRVIVRLETAGQYPHNGLSGLTLGPLGDLYFSLGENLGAPYRLVGSDGTALSGGGEGGSIYRCRPDGRGLTRVATGFWNTFGLGFDAFGRLFAVDNDPDSRGPCRLLHIVPGGDYGYRYRNGRKGLHPFTAWDGELPGTLPMVAGTSEAPCAVLAYESTGLPAEYRGNLLTTSWGDHLVERFRPTPRGASFTARAQALVRGGEDFRPVALAAAPDGSLYLSDWVDKSYPVHGKGRLWRLRMKQSPADDSLRPAVVARLGMARLPALLGHPRREIRAAAGDTLARQGRAGQAALADVARHGTDPRARAQALWSAARAEPPAAEVVAGALADPAPEVRAAAAGAYGRLLPPHPGRRDEDRLLELARHDPSAEVRLHAMLRLRTPSAQAALVRSLADLDAFLMAAALEALGRPTAGPVLRAHATAADPKLRLGVLLALRRGGTAAGRQTLPRFLEDADPAVRRAAIQWVGEERLREFAPLLERAAERQPVTRDVFEAWLAAQELLDRGARPNPGDEWAGEAYVARVLQDARRPPPLRALALRMLRPDHPALTPAELGHFLTAADHDLHREAVRALMLRPDEACQGILRRVAADRAAAPADRAAAILGLAHSAPTSARTRRLLVGLLAEPTLTADALRSLRDAADGEAAGDVLAWWDQHGAAAPPAERSEWAEQVMLTLRSVHDPETAKRLTSLAARAGQHPRDEAGWRAALAGPGDPAAGERVFFHARGARCFACHRVDGRGGNAGPDLSGIGRGTSRDKLIESIVAPSKEVAPRFTSWLIATRDGKLRTGVIVDEGPNSTVTLADNQGRLETIPRTEIEDRQAVPTSIMPDNLPGLMTRREFRDLLAYLESRK